MENARTMERGDGKAACIPQAGPVIYSAAEIMWVIRPEIDNRGNQCLFFVRCFSFHQSQRATVDPALDNAVVCYYETCLQMEMYDSQSLQVDAHGFFPPRGMNET